MNSSYLQRLTERLAGGLTRAPGEFVARHRRYLAAAQNADGGFSGREGSSDLYYTTFALRGLACVQGLTSPVLGPAEQFLRARAQQPAAVVDFLSLLYAGQLVRLAGGADVLSEHRADWPDRVAETLESVRSPDGGYGRGTAPGPGSTYYTFLVGLCYELIGRPMPGIDRVVAFLQSRRREDGGYVEVAPARRSGANPTAAALTLLTGLGALDPPTRDAAVAFLAGLQSAEGGFCANPRVPFADLLSTFTCLLTLDQLGAGDRIDRPALVRYVAGIEVPAGGFRAGAWDEVADVEYTFYGLGSVALLGSR
jgi:geranylgeranyl transferase type-2 subunit beta